MGYRGGHILRLKVINFMTYDELEIFPKHGLNLVVGLNGSGKSSIMCAICLGLAGKPQSTGRSGHLSGFIKYGCDKATIEIELDNLSKRNILITRIIHGDKSTFLLNKCASSPSEVLATVKKFNIDIGNLCQFLPQEKVSEFAKMDKKARLDNMLQAIGDPRLYQMFIDLKQMKTNSSKIEEEISLHQQTKNAEDQRIERIKVDVEKQKQRAELKEHLETLLQQKMYWDYQIIKQRSDEIKQQIQPLHRSIQSQKSALVDINDRYKKRSSAVLENYDQINQAKRTSTVLQDKITECENKLSNFHETSQNAKIHYQNRIEEKRNQVQKLQEIKQQVHALRNLVEKNNLEFPNHKEEDAKITQQLEEYKVHISKLNQSYAYITMEKNKLEYSLRNNMRELAMLKDEENKRLEVLKVRYHDVYEGVVWLQQNRDRFRAPIHNPMLTLLKIENEENTKYIENLISQRDLLAFICEDKEDNKLLTQILRVQKKLNVNIVMAPDKPLSSYRSRNLTNQYRQWGLMCFVKDIISAPDAVMCFLCECYKLHLIPICNSSGQNNMQEILKEFRSFFTPGARFSGKHSKYGNKNFSIRRDPIKGRKIIPSNKDHSDQIQELLAKNQAMKAEMEKYTSQLLKLEDERKACEREENDLREKKRTVCEQIREHLTYERQLAAKVNTYEQKKTCIIDEEVEKITLVREILLINSKKISVINELKTFLEDFITCKKQRLACNLKSRLLKKKLVSIQRIIKEKGDQLKTAERELEELNQDKANIKEKGIALYNKIKRSIPEGVRPDNLLKTYSSRSKEEIEKDIHNVQAKLEITSEENEAVLEEYHQLQKRTAEIATDIASHEARLKLLRADIEKKKNEWLPCLSKHIRNINGKFSQYYKQLKCAGEISLDTCNNSDDFLNYGLQITLKYRDNEPFMELSNTHHSGGECSVAAIIFILSLQELTEVPFRCIDEINQGMDAENERSMYHLISDSAKSGSCSQYFLLTPKLLTGLEMLEHKDVTVHLIFNSNFLEVEMNIQKHIELFDS